MTKSKSSPSQNIIAVDLTEREWVKVLEISTPVELYWLSRISMLQPVIFARQDLGLLIFSLRIYADSIKAPTKRRLLEEIADKMAKIMQAPPSSAKKQPLKSKDAPNDKPTAIKLMRQDLRRWKKALPTADVAMRANFEKMSAILKLCESGRGDEEC